MLFDRLDFSWHKIGRCSNTNTKYKTAWNTHNASLILSKTWNTTTPKLTQKALRLFNIFMSYKPVPYGIIPIISFLILQTFFLGFSDISMPDLGRPPIVLESLPLKNLEIEGLSIQFPNHTFQKCFLVSYFSADLVSSKSN